MIKKIAYVLCFLLLFSCKHKQGGGDESQVIQKKVYIKSMAVISESVDIDEWKVTIPYTSRALDKSDFDVVLSLPSASFSISPLPLKIEGGKSAKVVVTGSELSQEVEVCMRKAEHTVNFMKPQDGFLTLLDEENKQISTGSKISDGNILTLSASSSKADFVVDCYKINGKRLFWGKGNTTLEVKEDLNIEVFFTEKNKFSFVSVSEEHLAISKEKWMDFLDWEDYPDVYVEPFAMGRTEVPYPVWKEIRDWAKNHGYHFNNEGQNGAHFVSNTETKPFDEDGKLYPAVSMSPYDMRAWCNALVDYMNEKHSGEEGYVPLTYVYKFAENGMPFKGAEVDFPKFSFPPAPDTGVKFQKALDFSRSIVIDRKATGYRLPTRFEWIVAGRGGNPNVPAWDFRFPGSNDLDDVTHYHVKGSGKLKTLHPICSKNPNSLGLYDIVGNADECTDTKSKSGDMWLEVIGGSSFDDKDSFGRLGWFQDGTEGMMPPWGGSGTLGGGTHGFAATGFRLAFSIR